ncbi:MAG: alkane 1-monooxygenase [Rhodocyclaceae bacterium]|nr:alkane 1-monooxygenase [Rhodocyclaceae bacterium]
MAFARMERRRALATRKAAYLLFLLTPTLMPAALHLGSLTGLPDLMAWYPVFWIFGLIPVLDFAIGEDRVNPDEATETRAMQDDPYYRALTLLAVPIQAVMLAWGAWVFADWPFGPWGMLGWLVSMGVVSGINAINIAHELVHRHGRLEPWAGGFLLSLVGYAGFKVEHVRGHHVNVSTPLDASSARYGQSLYAFLPHAWKWNFLNAWRLEAERLRRRGLPALHWHNELIWWHGLSLAVAGTLAWAFGWLGLVFFAGQSFVAFTELEIINYVEHYGLHRRVRADGRFERTTHQHSWNSSYLLTNLFLFQLQRHSDHHAHPARRYQVLRHFDDSPQLPAGYATMVLLALVPPLWHRVMDPRVEAYYGDEPEQLAAVR